MLASKTRLPSNVKFVEENLNCFNKPVPQGVTGCWVILIGGGAPGGICAGGGGGAPGGVGGGGGARVGWVYIPRGLLGPTYTTIVGQGGGKDGVSANDGGRGTASVFASGSVILTAGGGVNYTGGVASAVGISVPMANGYNGGASSRAAGSGGYTNAPAGGGAGGNANANDAGNVAGVGGSSGSVGGTNGGYNGTAGTSAANCPIGFGGGGGGGGGGGWFTNGGPGGNGGKYGGGGGGSGGNSGGTQVPCSIGGDGCVAVIWVSDTTVPKPSQAISMVIPTASYGSMAPSWMDLTSWQAQASPNGYFADVVNGEYLRMPADMLVNISASVSWAGAVGTGAKGDYGPYNQLEIADSTGTVLATGALVYGGSGTITATYNGCVSEGQCVTAKPQEWNVSGYGVYTGGSFVVTPYVWL